MNADGDDDGAWYETAAPGDARILCVRSSRSLAGITQSALPRANATLRHLPYALHATSVASVARAIEHAVVGGTTGADVAGSGDRCARRGDEVASLMRLPRRSAVVVDTKFDVFIGPHTAVGPNATSSLLPARSACSGVCDSPLYSVDALMYVLRNLCGLDVVVIGVYSAARR